MKSEISTSYKGHTIEYDEKKDNWAVSPDIGYSSQQPIQRKQNLVLAKAYVDRLIKGEFKRVNVFWFEGWSNDKLRFGEATSLMESGAAWVVDGGGNRSKQGIVYLDTENNRALAERITQDNLEIERLNGQIKNAKRLLVHLTKVEMKQEEDSE